MAAPPLLFWVVQRWSKTWCTSSDLGWCSHVQSPCNLSEAPTVRFMMRAAALVSRGCCCKMNVAGTDANDRC